MPQNHVGITAYINETVIKMHFDQQKNAFLGFRKQKRLKRLQTGRKL